MPHKMPDSYKEWLKTYVPPTHKVWWMRGIITHIEQKTAKNTGSGFPGYYFRLLVCDVDAPADEKQSYEFDIDGGKHKDVRPQDRISVFGHESIEATYLSTPRFCYNHETTVYGPAYQTHFIDRNFFPITDYIAVVEGSRTDKKHKFWGGVAGAMGMLPEEVNQRFVGGGFDMLPIYKTLSSTLNKYVHQMPDPLFPCVNPRPENSHRGGSLVE